MFRNYLTIAFRQFWKQKLFSSINLIGLSLGLTCSLLIFLWVQDELSYDQFYANKDRLFLVLADWNYSDGSREISPNTPANLAHELTSTVPEIVRTARIMADWAVDNYLRVGEREIKQSGIYADSTLLAMLSYPLRTGDPQRALRNPRSMVISQATAQTLFGTDDALDKTVTLSDSEGNRDYLVTGILADMPETSALRFDFIIPYPELEGRHAWLTKWGSASIVTLVELSHPEAVASVNEIIAPLMAQYKDDLIYKLRLFPYPDVHLKAPFRANDIFYQGSITYVYLFSVVALLVLVIACINFINLSTARASQRATEVGIRKAVGAPRRTLIGQFMLEALLTVVIATGLAMLLVELCLPLFNRMVAKALTVPYTEFWFIGLVAGVVGLAVLLAGSYPALVLSSFNPVATLKGGRGNNSRKGRLRQTLVVAQFVFSTMLIVGTFTIHYQIQYIQEKNLGLDRSNVLRFSTNPTLNKHFEAFREDLIRHPAFQSVTRTAENPLSTVGESSDPWWPGKSEDDDRDFSLSMVDYDFFETLGISFVAGRDFSPQHAQDTVSYVLNEEAARQMGLEHPVGTELGFWRGKGQIIGVVNDFHYRSLHEAIGPMIFMLWPENTEQVYLRIAPGHTAEAVATLPDLYARYDPMPVDYQFLDESFDRMYRTEKRVGAVTNAFTGLAIIISALGLLGMSTFAAQRRRKEIGVRKVLGASVRSLLLLLSRDYLKLMIIALSIAIPLANFVLAEWLTQFAYHVRLQWWLFALPGLLVLLIALLTVSIQTLKAARSNPVDSLQYE